MNTKYLPFLFATIFFVGCGSQTAENTNPVVSVPEVVSEEAQETSELSPLDTGEEAPSYDGSYVADNETTVIGWTGKAIGKQHNGVVKLTSGSFDIAEGVGNGTFVIDMTTIQTLEIKGPGAKGLDDHLKNEDFFAVEAHPTATLVLKDIDVVTGGEVALTGDLTIKEITNTISFTASFKEEGGEYIVNSDFSIDRTLWDVRYGSGTFFSDIGDKAISDDMEFSLMIVLKK